jgi:peptide maturation system protein (TIGR04066 family)
MGEKERLLIYPFSIEGITILRYKDLLCSYHIDSLVCPKGFCFSGMDAGIIDKGPMVGVKVTDEFENELHKIDTVLFIKYDIDLKDWKRDLMDKVRVAADSKKNILCTVELEEDFLVEIKGLCEKSGRFFKYYHGDGKLDNLMPKGEKLFEIKTPVIAVYGLSERCRKFDVQLSLRQNLLKQGYSISQVGSRNYCELFGFHPFPKFMFSKGLHESDKIILLNHYVKNLELKEKPDVIIIGIPGGVMPINNDITSYFGITAFEVSQAVLPDAVVFSTLYADYENIYFEKIHTSLKYKLGCEIDCFHISNVQFDYNNFRKDKKESYLTLDYKIIEKKKKKLTDLQWPVFSVLETENAEGMAEFIVDRLARNDYTNDESEFVV